MRHLTYLLLGILCFILTLGACSTTKNLPEGEQLYTGISQITFNDADIKKPKRKQEKADTAGVITAIDNAVQTVGNLFSYIKFLYKGKGCALYGIRAFLRGSKHI